MGKNKKHELVTHDLLQTLSPVGAIPWELPGMTELYQFRYSVWRMIRSGGLVGSPWAKSVFDNLFGSHPLSWRVVGMTRSALHRLGGVDMSFTGKREPGVYIRSHLYPRRQTSEDLRVLSLDTTYDEFVSLTWPRDITIIGLKSEDVPLEDPAYYQENAVTWRNDQGTYFTEAGKGWKYGKKERQYLRDLNLSTR